MLSGCNSGKARIDILGLSFGLAAVNWIYSILGRVKIKDESAADPAATTLDGGHQFGRRLVGIWSLSNKHLAYGW